MSRFLDDIWERAFDLSGHLGDVAFREHLQQQPIDPLVVQASGRARINTRRVRSGLPPLEAEEEPAPGVRPNRMDEPAQGQSERCPTVLASDDHGGVSTATYDPRADLDPWLKDDYVPEWAGGPPEPEDEDG